MIRVALVCALLAGCSDDRLTDERVPQDFACSGGLVIEDIDRAVMADGVWLVYVPAGMYAYRPREGELCAYVE